MPAVITCVDDMRELARKRVPRMFYDFVDSGSWSGWTYAKNTSDFQKWTFRQRVGVDISNRNLESTMIGEPVSMPVAIAPTGMAGMQHPDGEMLAARAAQKAGIPFVLSTMSICSIEDVSAALGGAPFWFQLYVMKDRNFVSQLIARAKQAGCSALVVTMDLQAAGQRHQAVKQGLSIPWRLTVRQLLDVASKPAWLYGLAKTKRRNFGNIVGHLPGFESIGPVSGWAAKQFDPSLTWDDIDWIREQWPGKLILKGILDEDDAERAVALGVDAIVVSNHGGRQLDGAPSSIAMLPHIVQRVGNRIEVHMDGGVHSGQDVLKALALGARGVYIGRAMLYGLGAMGQSGVEKILEIIRKELDLSMAFCGCARVDGVTHDLLRNLGDKT